MIYISTLAFKGSSVEDIINVAEKERYNIEFSSGLPFSSEMETIYKNCTVPRMPHNYFPAPEIPFVLNLASLNEDIRRESINHCKRGLDLAKQANAPFFAAHAGFCIDPDPKELGNQLIAKEFDKAECWSRFLDSLSEILAYAEQLDTPFLIENNVIAEFNLVNGENPLLCCDSAEISRLFKEMNFPKYLGLLLDTGHFKVSAQTLGFNMDVEVEKIASYIKGIHHNDNDGKRDVNNQLTTDYWFFNHLSNYVSTPQVLEVKCDSLGEVQEQFQLLTNQINKNQLLNKA